MNDEAMRAAFEAQWYARPGTPLLWREGGKPNAPYLDSEMNHRWKEWGIAWQAATLAEQERCAKVCDQQAARESYSHAKHAVGACADAIRKGETP